MIPSLSVITETGIPIVLLSYLIKILEHLRNDVLPTFTIVIQALRNLLCFSYSFLDFRYLQHLQITVQSCIHITCKQLFHCSQIMFYMVFIKRIVVRNPVCKLNVNWRISGFHQFQIHKPPPCPSISVSLCQVWDKRFFSNDMKIIFDSLPSLTYKLYLTLFAVRQSVYLKLCNNPRIYMVLPILALTL